MKYLVNRQTKEHVKKGLAPLWLDEDPDWRIVEADDDGWIPFQGTDCPVPDKSRCDVILVNGETRYLSNPGGFKWGGFDAIYAVCYYLPILSEIADRSSDHIMDAASYFKQVTAANILKTAIGHMEERAVTYDKPSGERSMGKTVAMFNTLTEHGLTEEQGWLFMACLKMVRSQQGDYRADSYEDGAAYFALAGEIAAQEREK